MRLRSPFWCHRSKKPVQGFEQGLNKVSSFQAVPTQDPPTHAYLCHSQSAFCPTLPTPPMPDASKLGANSLFKSTPSRTAARPMRPPGVEPGAQAWRLVCMDFWSISLATRTRRHACSCLPHSSQGLRIPPPWGPLPKFAILAASKHICMTKCIASDCRCVRWSLVRFRVAGLGLVQAFWHKGQAAVMEELPLASKQSRSSQKGSPNLMSRQFFFCTK